MGKAVLVPIPKFKVLNLTDLSSAPTQTPVTKSGVNPMNQPSIGFV